MFKYEEIIITGIVIIFTLMSTNIIMSITNELIENINNKNILYNNSNGFIFDDACSYKKSKDLIHIRVSKELNEIERQHIMNAKCVWETIIEKTFDNHPGIYVNVTIEELEYEKYKNTIAITKFKNNLVFHNGFKKRIMPYNSNIKLNKNMYQHYNLTYIMIHEFGHALGFHKNIWNLNRNSQKNQSEYTGKHAVKNFNRIFNTNYTSIPLNDDTKDKPNDSHWKRLNIVDKYGNIFKNDIMNPYIVNKSTLSMVTIGTLQDNGYKINSNLCIDDSDCFGKCMHGFINMCQ
jgi:hypothetical protein